jgi:hypothetical protein
MKQTLYLQMWHGYWRVREPVPKLLIPVINRGQYLARSPNRELQLGQDARAPLCWPNSITSSNRRGCG